MKPLVYIESSVVSYLTAQPKDIISQGRVAVTVAWWEQSAKDYECILSQYVLDEVGVGNEDKAKRRLEVIQACRVLDVDRELDEALCYEPATIITPDAMLQLNSN